MAEVKRNVFGNYEHAETHFVFDRSTKEVYGKQVGSKVESLTADDIHLCKELRFKYRSPIDDGSVLNVNDGENDEYEEDSEDTDEETEEGEESKKVDDKKDIEEKYRELLIDTFVKKWEKKFEEIFANDKCSCVTVNNPCSIVNVYGIRFFSHDMVYSCHTKMYYIEFDIDKNVDGIVRIKNEPNIFSVRGDGETIKEAFIKILDNMNKFLFCKHCGTIKREDQYYKELNKCECCLITDLLCLKKDHEEYCSICMENTKNYYTLNCKHKFHRACLSDLEDKKCPLCRISIRENSYESDNDEE